MRAEEVDEYLARLDEPKRSIPAECGGSAAAAWLSPVAIRLYGQVQDSRSSTSAYRDLWRILESAFQARNRELSKLLAQYPEAQQIGFDLDEIEHLRTLRGRASHAESRAVLKELMDVDELCAKKLPRLRHLALRLIIGEREWNSRSLERAELPKSSYVAADGSVVLALAADSQGESP